MAKKLFLLFLLTLVLGVPTLAAAPSDTVRAELFGNNLRVWVQHQSKDPKTDYVSQITVSQNGSQIITQNFKNQIGNSQMAMFIISGYQKTDTITVSAAINGGGSLSATATEHVFAARPAGMRGSRSLSRPTTPKPPVPTPPVPTAPH